MRVVEAFPPNIEELKVAFPDAMGNVIFAYGDIIYDPWFLGIAPWNHVHEKVHEAQQGEMGVKEWWRKYIADPAFRVSQEIPAYRAEYQFLKTQTGMDSFRWAQKFATALSGPNYGNAISYGDALKAIIS